MRERCFDPAAGLSRRYIVQQVEQSLHRLRTDRIDLYYAHVPDPDTPLEQTLAVYDDLIRQGELRYAALSNHPAGQLTEALWIADDRRLVSAPVCAQVKYSRLARDWGLELYQVSLAWLLFRPAVASVIVGAETVAELRANASAADIELTPEQLDTVSSLTVRLAT